MGVVVGFMSSPSLDEALAFECGCRSLEDALAREYRFRFSDEEFGLKFAFCGAQRPSSFAAFPTVESATLHVCLFCSV